MAVQPKLRIQRTFSAAVARRIVEIMMECPEGPTFTVRRDPEGPQWLTVWMSQRTYNYLENKLRDLRQKGEI